MACRCIASKRGCSIFPSPFNAVTHFDIQPYHIQLLSTQVSMSWLASHLEVSPQNSGMASPTIEAHRFQPCQLELRHQALELKVLTLAYWNAPEIDSSNAEKNTSLIEFVYFVGMFFNNIPLVFMSCGHAIRKNKFSLWHTLTLIVFFYPVFKRTCAMCAINLTSQSPKGNTVRR